MHHYPASATTTTTLITNNIQNSETPNTIQNGETPVITKEKPGKIDYLINEWVLSFHTKCFLSMMQGNFHLFQRSIIFC